MQEAAGWAVVVPVKGLTVAKSRLHPYAAALRSDLALAMACDVVTAAAACAAVLRVVVVSSDAVVGAALADLGADVVPDPAGGGLVRALEHGAAEVAARHPHLGVAALAADLPALRAFQLGQALAAVAPGTRRVVADAAGTGTTLLAAAAGCRLGPEHGPGSFARHVAGGATALDAPLGLRLDVDTPDDLARALGLGVGARTAAAAAGLG